MTDQVQDKARVSALLEPHLSAVMDFRRRWLELDAFLQELEEVTRGKPFRVWGECAWRAMLDSRDMLVVHLASWARGTAQAGGLFGQLAGNHIRALRETPLPLKSDSEYLNRRHREHHQSAYERLFPKGPEGFPRPEDVASLKDSFWDQMTPVIKDRDANRAHSYEKKQQKGGNAQMLQLAELDRTIEFAETLLGDLQFVGTASQFQFPDSTPTRGIPDLVDLVVLGDRIRQGIVMGERKRDAFYEHLHVSHGQGDIGQRPWFNERRRT